MASSNQIGMPQDSRNTPSDLIQSPESLGLSLNYNNLASNSWPNLSQKFSEAGGKATSIDQLNSQTEFGPSQSQYSAFLDGSDALPDLPSIPLPEFPDLVPKDIPEFIDGIRQWLRNPQRPECHDDYHELCCQKGAPDPIRGPPGRDPAELSTRRRKCSRCMHKTRSLLIVPPPPPDHCPACHSDTDTFFRVEKSTRMLFSRRRLLLLLHGWGTYINIIRIAPEFQLQKFQRPALIIQTAFVIDRTIVSNCI